MQVVYARTTTHVAKGDGTPHLVQYGQFYSAKDPIVLRYPQLFSADPRDGGLAVTDPSALVEDEPPVEQATASPGERRNLPPRRPGK